MLKLFQKKSKVKEGKQTQADANAQTQQKKKEAPLAAFGKTWKKLNSMDRKQAYTWGAVILVGVIGLLILASAASGEKDDFSDFETRGYDLANMPFSSDEAEQYLLASKYPDMEEGNKGMGLYSAEEKEARQEEDAEQAELDTSASSSASEYVPGRYYGGGGSGRGTGARTQVGSLGSASIKGASGSGLSSKFGPSGDFSNFRSQNKGSDRAPGRLHGGDARTALRQTAMASRAAAGLKNDKMLNAKKALMGGNVEGSKAFMDDSGAVNLGEAAGLDLDTNAPTSSADLSGLDQGLNDAKDKGQKDGSDNDDEKNEWEEFAIEFLKKAIDFGLQLAEGAVQDAIKVHQQQVANYQVDLANAQMEGKLDPPPTKLSDGSSLTADMLGNGDANVQAGLKGAGWSVAEGQGFSNTSDSQTWTSSDGQTVTVNRTPKKDNDGNVIPGAYDYSYADGQKAPTVTKKQANAYNKSALKTYNNSDPVKKFKKQSFAQTKSDYYGNTSRTSTLGTSSGQNVTYNGVSYWGRVGKDGKFHIDGGGTLDTWDGKGQ
ncbi:MAG: hypothetical protein IKN49_05860 [Elusimicrobiaceae bacterium]|nr:hypothetical protein [Elusimicrobiaceae bacterium]